MTASAAGTAKRPSRRTIGFVLAGLVVALFFGANAHLVYVAFASQPECVPHAKEVGVEGTPLRAARSAC